MTRATLTDVLLYEAGKKDGIAEERARIVAEVTARAYRLDSDEWNVGYGDAMSQLIEWITTPEAP